MRHLTGIGAMPEWVDTGRKLHFSRKWWATTKEVSDCFSLKNVEKALFYINDFAVSALYTGGSLLLILWRMLWLTLL
ncbi:hypothetical protein VT06_03970 [Arsukibacterium sp. MJ3]|uniref:hypothetical protein n=1 Tax=Arsukibacterium sp. MJ3 TaxID=1632859 RepID=UPI0006270E48|nr:hypothetical protein [Arsukibacterium sp. MJ3]KKO49764.1 hypothetical protein VT06_03970 [Arsukibacterium sp. MJ3]